jgi:septin family protein
LISANDIVTINRFMGNVNIFPLISPNDIVTINKLTLILINLSIL